MKHPFTRIKTQKLPTAGVRHDAISSIANLNPPPIAHAIAERRMHVAGDMRISRPVFNDPQTYEIIGAGMAVRRELGCGFLEPVNRAAFTIELEHRGIPFVREAPLPVHYRDRLLPVFYRVDFICYGEILVELKALPSIGPVEDAPVDQLFACGAPQPRPVVELRSAELPAQTDRSRFGQ